MTASGWLLPLDFGVVPCSKCHSRDFIGQYRKRPVYHLNRSLGGRRLVRLPGMAASNVCERVLSTLSRHPDESTTTVIQPGDKCKAKASSGLEVPPAATFSTCV